MDTDLVAGVFADHLGAEVRVQSLKQTFPGQSQETWMVDATVGDTQAGFVLRINPPGGGIVPLPLRREWDVYRLLWDTEIPVGRPLWYDEGHDAFEGRPYFVRDLVDGRSDVPGVHDEGPDGDVVRKEVGYEHARALAALHTLDWEAAGFGDILDVPNGPQDAAKAEFDYWSSVWHDVKSEPFPVVTRALSWFEHHLPQSAPRLSLLKGNNGLGEEIWKGQTIVALSDWELASLGDPAQDWAFSQGLLDLHDREEVLDYYESVAGFELERANLDYWTVWTVFKAICCTAAGLRGFLDGRDLRPVLPAIGFGSVHLAEQLLGHIYTLDLATAASMVSTLTAAQVREPAAGGPGRS